MSKWVVRRPQPGAAEMAAALGIPRMVAQVFCNRKVDLVKARQCLNGTLNDLSDPFLMAGMREAIDMLQYEIAAGGRIRAATDYDNDGIQCASVALMAFARLGVSIDYDLPERDEGYGLSTDIVDRATRDGITLLVTMDNGIAAHAAVQYALDQGIRVIVTDHHELPRDQNGAMLALPSAGAVIDPCRDDCRYPDRYLCGAGVTFTLLRALYRARGRDERELYNLLPLVAMATVTDVMDLTGENRILVREGLLRLQDTQIVGLNALIDATHMRGRALTAYHMGFVFGPCMNAAGRLRSARLGVELMICDNEEEAARMAQELCALNEERKTLTQQGIETALHEVETRGFENDKIIVVHDASLPDSVAGIVAGKLRDRFERPSIVLTGTGDELRGSGRSSQGYDLFASLSMHRELFISMGGHRMAAGMSMRAEHIDALRRLLNEECALSLDDLEDRVRIDMLVSPDLLTLADAEAFAALEPYGNGFPCPLLAVKDARVDRFSVVGAQGNVVRMRVWGAQRYAWAVWFRGTEPVRQALEARGGTGAFERALEGESVRLSLAYYSTVNLFGGVKNIQMNIQYIQ